MQKTSQDWSFNHRKPLVYQGPVHFFVGWDFSWTGYSYGLRLLESKNQN